MHFYFRNVNDAFQQLVTAFNDGMIPTTATSSRVGNVLAAKEPITVTYSHPWERVLFNRARDCNPFFHLFESLWMLAGRNDVAPLTYYNPRMVDYSDDGETLHGAYGYRWRKRFGWDQLNGIIRELRDNPDSRRCVLSIWNSCFHDSDKPEDVEDMEAVLNGIEGPAKDVPCNTHVYFAIQGYRLDMTVCNRSNDLIWGMLGANVVHFSMLQEYLATYIGVDVGQYHQVTNNLHVYTERWEPVKWLAEYQRTMHSPPRVSYESDKSAAILPMNLVRDPLQFDHECARFVDSIDGDFQEPFLRSVAQPMCAAFRAHKSRNYRDNNNALRIIERVHSADWRIAGTVWIEKRMKAWEDKSHAQTSS